MNTIKIIKASKTLGLEVGQVLKVDDGEVKVRLCGVVGDATTVNLIADGLAEEVKEEDLVGKTMTPSEAKQLIADYHAKSIGPVSNTIVDELIRASEIVGAVEGRETWGHLTKDIVWMARRYAEGRATGAPGMFNAAYSKMRKIHDYKENVDPDNRSDESAPIKDFPWASERPKLKA